MSTIYLKIINSKGHTRVEQRLAWDTAKFLESVTKEYASNKDDPCRVEVATREDYLRSIQR